MQARVPQKTADSEEDEAPSVELRLYMLSNAAVTKEPGQTAHLVIDSRRMYPDAESRLLSRPPMSLCRRMMVTKLQPQRPETLIACFASSKGVLAFWITCTTATNLLLEIDDV